MGWASAVSIFDKVVSVTEKYIPDSRKAEVYGELYKELRDGDWDTVSESDYFYSDWMEQILEWDCYFDEEYYPKKEYIRERYYNG